MQCRDLGSAIINNCKATIRMCDNFQYVSLLIERRRFEIGDPSAALYQFGVLLDPVSESAQKWSALLVVRTPFS